MSIKNHKFILFLKATTLALELGVEMTLHDIHRGNREMGDLQLTTLDSGLEGDTALQHFGQSDGKLDH